MTRMTAAAFAAILAITLTVTTQPAGATGDGPTGDTDTTVQIPDGYEEKVLEATRWLVPRVSGRRG